MMDVKCLSIIYYGKLSFLVVFDFGRFLNLRFSMVSKGDILNVYMFYIKVCMFMFRLIYGFFRF